MGLSFITPSPIFSKYHRIIKLFYLVCNSFRFLRKRVGFFLWHVNSHIQNVTNFFKAKLLAPQFLVEDNREIHNRIFNGQNTQNCLKVKNEDNSTLFGIWG